MKNKIELNYLTPLEFVSMYTKKVLEDGFDSNTYSILIDFARSVNYGYCPDHNIFSQYEGCPFCTLEI